ncbi:DUF742 domain-containing protein [Streptomyces sp. NBRC 109706]|uniref:DUF742 domain-containing protein n=1 Tax=Streptomyces sp. NBRC 109706 TaxID=1550035 RepID=UPI0007838AD8|nr:DUF742 domain-containing protein [Streptomyces sp. NBRC 109706]
MTRPGRDDDPDRLYTVTKGRSRAASQAFDLVTLVVSESEPTAGMQSEHARILRMCQFPTAVVEISAELRMPITVVRILLSDLLDMGRITARHPRTAGTANHLPDSNLLEQVLVGLRNL